MHASSLPNYLPKQTTESSATNSNLLLTFKINCINFSWRTYQFWIDRRWKWWIGRTSSLTTTSNMTWSSMTKPPPMTSHTTWKAVTLDHQKGRTMGQDRVPVSWGSWRRRGQAAPYHFPVARLSNAHDVLFSFSICSLKESLVWGKKRSRQPPNHTESLERKTDELIMKQLVKRLWMARGSHQAAALAPELGPFLGHEARDTKHKPLAID